MRHALPIDQSGGQMDILAGHARGVTAQMTYWTYVWVVRPLVVIAFALIRYIAGHGTWSAVLRGHGETPYEVRWVGPQGQQRWSVNYVQETSCTAEAWSNGPIGTDSSAAAIASMGPRIAKEPAA